MLKVAILTTDSREHFQDYGNPQPYFGTAPAALLQGLAQRSAIEVHVVSCLQQPVVSPERLAPNTWYHGLRVPKSGWLRTGYQGCLRAVRACLKRVRPDLVHAQGTERDCALCGVFSGYPNLLTIHGNMRRVAQVTHARPWNYNWLMARLESFVLPRTQGVVCITRHTQAQVRSLARRTWLVPNAVDESFFALEARPAPAKRLLCVGSICALKNQSALIRALDPAAKHEQFELCFLGGANPDEAYSREFLELVRQRPWCRYEGFVGPSALKTYLQNASALVLPSLEENCPMVLLEAMAAGVPVAASNVGGVPDVITEPGVNGLLFDPLRPEQIRAVVERLVRDSGASREMAGRAKTHAAARFHPHAIARRHQEIYEELLRTPS